jgi:hypothetical protein
LRERYGNNAPPLGTRKGLCQAAHIIPHALGSGSPDNRNFEVSGILMVLRYLFRLIHCNVFQQLPAPLVHQPSRLFLVYIPITQD